MVQHASLNVVPGIAKNVIILFLLQNIYTSEWVIVFLTPTLQIFSYTMARTS